MVTRRSYEEFDDKITEQRYKDKKVIRVYLKTDVSNTQAEVLIKEFQKIEGVNGTWYVSKSLLEENSKKSDKTSSPEISAIIDVFIEEPSLKGIVIETIQENDYVQKVEDLN
ncbi:hypothetical protein HYU92_02115 [Candidatus Curtissbacteria bacterium]|nr:hypothetical protein [Candidatus Curtissbacteria bacterium]